MQILCETQTKGKLTGQKHLVSRLSTMIQIVQDDEQFRLNYEQILRFAVKQLGNQFIKIMLIKMFANNLSH